MAITEAATVPVIAPRIAPTAMTAYPRPPRTGPKSWPRPSSRSSARPQRSRIAPISVKNGIASSVSFAMMPNTRSGSACIRLKSKKPCLMAMKPKNRPTAASENDTGKPISMKTTRPPNIRGAIRSCGIKQQPLRVRNGSLQGPLVMEIRLHVPGKHGEALDQLGKSLQAEQREAEREEDLDRPADEPAGVAR